LTFAPDFLWLKSRGSAQSHALFDLVRGTGQRLQSNATSAEDAYSSYFTGFTSDGFTLNQNSGINQNNDALVAWAWDAGSSNTTIAAGSLNSSLYNQSQTWSSGGSISNSGENPVNYTNTFDGIISGVGAAPNYAEGWRIGGTSLATGTSTVSGLNIAFSESVKVRYFKFIYSGSNSNTQFKINNVSLLDGTATTSTYQDIDVTSSITSPITSLEINRNAGNNNLQIAGIYIDGKLLVDSGVTPPNVPSIASTVRANPSAGFSISKYDNSNAAGTFAHSLSSMPEFFIIKNLVQDSWMVWSKAANDVIGRDDGYLFLNLTNAIASGVAAYFPGGTNASTVSVGASSNTGGNCIAYCFAPVEGYSSFGSFQNPSSSEGAFVHLGFKPALLMVKCALNISSSSGAGDWIIKDSTRSPFNNPSDGNTLVANVANAEDGYYGAGQAAIDILSNGFKIRHPNSSPAGDTGRLYIYAAWAESPFKTARAQ
jgi:hypothetical protein